jgi:hypothetical protein
MTRAQKKKGIYKDLEALVKKYDLKDKCLVFAANVDGDLLGQTQGPVFEIMATLVQLVEEVQKEVFESKTEREKNKNK